MLLTSVTWNRGCSKSRQFRVHMRKYERALSPWLGTCYILGYTWAVALPACRGAIVVAFPVWHLITGRSLVIAAQQLTRSGTRH